MSSTFFLSLVLPDDSASLLSSEAPLRFGKRRRRTNKSSDQKKRRWTLRIRDYFLIVSNWKKINKRKKKGRNEVDGKRRVESTFNRKESFGSCFRHFVADDPSTPWTPRVKKLTVSFVGNRLLDRIRLMNIDYPNFSVPLGTFLRINGQLFDLRIYKHDAASLLVNFVCNSKARQV